MSASIPSDGSTRRNVICRGASMTPGRAVDVPNAPRPSSRLAAREYRPCPQLRRSGARWALFTESRRSLDLALAREARREAGRPRLGSDAERVRLEERPGIAGETGAAAVTASRVAVD